jgi:hypothetical protein
MWWVALEISHPLTMYFRCQQTTMSYNLLSNARLPLPLNVGAKTYGQIRVKKGDLFFAELDDQP